MLHQITWQPDTCQCEVVTGTDSEQPNRDPIYVKTVFACPEHAPFGGRPEHLITLLEENRRKNQFEADFLLNAPEVREDIPRSLAAMTEVLRRMITTINGRGTLSEGLLLEGLTHRVYREGRGYKWSFDAKRNLVVDVTGLGGPTLQYLSDAAANPKYNGRVILRG